MRYVKEITGESIKIKSGEKRLNVELNEETKRVETRNAKVPAITLFQVIEKFKEKIRLIKNVIPKESKALVLRSA